jgi:hypothetical protein
VLIDKPDTNFTNSHGFFPSAQALDARWEHHQSDRFRLDGVLFRSDGSCQFVKSVSSVLHTTKMKMRTEVLPPSRLLRSLE